MLLLKKTIFVNILSVLKVMIKLLYYIVLNIPLHIFGVNVMVIFLV